MPLERRWNLFPIFAERKLMVTSIWKLEVEEINFLLKSLELSLMSSDLLSTTCNNSWLHQQPQQLISKLIQLQREKLRVLIIWSCVQNINKRQVYIHKIASAHKIYLYSWTTLHLICSAGLCWHMHVWYQITEEIDVQFVRMQWI
jgi:hypothetical protein